MRLSLPLGTGPGSAGTHTGSVQWCWIGGGGENVSHPCSLGWLTLPAGGPELPPRCSQACVLAGGYQLAPGEDPQRPAVQGGLQAVVGGLQGLHHLQRELAQGLELDLRSVSSREQTLPAAGGAGLLYPEWGRVTPCLWVWGCLRWRRGSHLSLPLDGSSPQTSSRPWVGGLREEHPGSEG